MFLDLEFEDEPEFPIEEELADGEEIDQDILLEGEEECDNDANDEGDDEDIDEEDVVEEEEKADDGEVKELEACLEIIKLDDAEDDNVQAEANDDSNDKQDEVHVDWVIRSGTLFVYIAWNLKLMLYLWSAQLLRLFLDEETFIRLVHIKEV